MSRCSARCSSPFGKSCSISCRVKFSPIGIRRRSSSSIGPIHGSGFKPRSMGMVSLLVYPIRLCKSRPIMTSESNCMSCQSLKRKSLTLYKSSCCFWKRTCESNAVKPSLYCLKVLSRTRFCTHLYSTTSSEPSINRCSSILRIYSASSVCL